MTVREAVADVLVSEGVEVVFALMGDANQDLIVDLGERCGMRIVFGRHEQGVVGMADGYSRFTGKHGIATVTQGPGLTNAGTSLVVAHRRRSPVLVVAGDTPLGDHRNPQLFDQISFAKLMAGAGGRLESGRGLDDVMTEAFDALRSSRPYVLNLPTDVQGITLESGAPYLPRTEPVQHMPAQADLIAAAAELLASAEQPAILAGRGAVVSGAAPALIELAELLGAPLMTTLLANGLFAGHALEAGTCGGLGDGRALRALEHCDLVVAVGASLNQWTTHFGTAFLDRRVIQIDSDLSALGGYQRADLALNGDAQCTAHALLAELQGTLSAPHLPSDALKNLLEERVPLDPSPYLDTPDSVDPRHALSELDRLLPAGRSIVIAGGHAAQVACQTVHASSPYDWTCTAVDFGALGQGLSVAVGACFARAGQRVIHVTADAELMMGISEFDTAVRYNLPLTIVVLNDQSVGQERHNLRHKGMPLTYADYPTPDFAELARCFGAQGYRIDNADALDRLVPALNHETGVVVIDVRINGEYLNPTSRDIAEHLG